MTLRLRSKNVVFATRRAMPSGMQKSSTPRVFASRVSVPTIFAVAGGRSDRCAASVPAVYPGFHRFALSFSSSASSRNL